MRGEIYLRTSPIGPNERIDSLDIIRGIALFGILLVNMQAFQYPDLIYQLYALTPQFNEMDQWIRLFYDLFVQTKFYTIFAFLFGLGFYIFMSRAEEKELKVKRLFSRRLLILFVFGLLHLVLLWFGDILHTYALCGFLLLLFYNKKNKTIIVWAFLLLLIVFVISSSQLLLPASSLEREFAQNEEKGYLLAEKTIYVYHHAGFMEWLIYRLQYEVVTMLMYSPLAILVILPMFLLGFYVGRKKLLQNVLDNLSFIKKVWWVTFIISLPWLMIIVLVYFNKIDFGIKNLILYELAVMISGLTLSIFYISSIVLLLLKKNLKKMLRPIGYVGQMALTNYIFQTIIGVSIFVGLGLYGEVNLLLGLVISLVIFPLQIVFSYYWLKSFRFGPLEWIWRTLTYGYRQPMRR